MCSRRRRKSGNSSATHFSGARPPVLPRELIDDEESALRQIGAQGQRLDRMGGAGTAEADAQDVRLAAILQRMEVEGLFHLQRYETEA